jgi:hypothetical protein
MSILWLSTPTFTRLAQELLSPPLVPVLRSRATAADGGGDKGEGEYIVIPGP